MRKVLWLAVLVLVLAPLSTWAAVLTVGPTGVYPTIQAAIDAAAPGDIIEVQGNRTYNENLVIDNFNGALLIIGGWAPGFGSLDPVAYPTVIDPGRDVYNLEIFGSPGVNPSVFLYYLIFTNSNLSTHNQFTGAIYAEADGGDVLLWATECTFEKFFTGDSPGVVVLNALGSSNIDVEFQNSTIAHNSGFGDNIACWADGPITAFFDSNYIFDNHFDGSPGLSFFTDFGGSFTADLQNNLITHNTSQKGTGGGLNIIANTGENRLISRNDTIYKNSAFQGGGAYIVSYQNSHTLASFTNSILNLNLRNNAYLSGNVDFGAAFCSLGALTRLYHTGTYHVANNFANDPRVLEYLQGKPYLASDSLAIGRGIGDIAGTATAAGTTTLLTDNTKKFPVSALVGRTITINGVTRTVLGNTATTITVTPALPAPVGLGNAYNVFGLFFSTATLGGSTTVLTDATQTFGVNRLIGRLIRVNHLAPPTIEYRIIASNTATTITFDTALDQVLAPGDVYLIISFPGFDIMGRVRPQPMGYDVGCFQTYLGATGTLTISGQITDLYTDTVLPGTAIFLEALNGGGEVINIRSTYANYKGNYGFVGLAAGNYRLVPRKTGYAFAPRVVSPTVANVDFQGHSFQLTGTLRIGGTIIPLKAASVYLNIDDWQSVLTNGAGVYTFNVVPGNYLVFPRKFLGIINNAPSEYRFYPTTAEAFNAGINGTATGGDIDTLVDTAIPWAGDFNVLRKLLIVTHADGSKEMRVIDLAVGSDLDVLPDFSTAPVAGDTYTIDPNGVVGLAGAGGTTTRIVDAAVPWGTMRVVGKRIIVIHAGGAVEYKAIAGVTGGNTLVLSSPLTAIAAAGDPYIILIDTLVGTATALGTTTTLIDATTPWGGVYLIGRPISFEHPGPFGTVVRETRIITDVAGGVITVDRAFSVAPAAGRTYEIDLFNYDFVGERVP